MASFTADQLIDKVRELATANPEYRYKGTNGGCYYRPKTFFSGAKSDSCIFGQAIKILDLVSYSQLKESVRIDTNLHLLDVITTPEQRIWVRNMQYSQDRGKRWGKCLRDADAAVEKAASLGRV